MGKIDKELKDAVIYNTKTRLKNCKENYQDLKLEIGKCLTGIDFNLESLPEYALSIVSNLNEMVSEYAILREKIKGLEREIELLELLKEQF